MPRQLAQPLGVPFEEVCGDFKALAEHDWRARHLAGGDTSLLRVAQRAHGPHLQHRRAPGPLRAAEDQNYDGHAFFYRNARPVLEQMGCALVMYRRDPKQTVPPLEEWSPWRGEIKPGHFHTTDLRETRRQLLLAEHNPQVTLRSLAQFLSLKLRAKGGQCVIRKLPEDWELLHAWAKGWGCTTAGRGWPR